MGAGLDYSKKIEALGDKTVFKVAVAGFNYSTDYDDTSVHYDADLKLANIGLLLDYHPFSGGFYISAGAYYNGNSIDFQATPTNGTYDINGNTYDATELGYLKGETNFNKFAPFIGIGYDNSIFGNGNLFLSSKLGAMYQGSPNIDLTGVCGQAIEGTAKCVQLQNDIEIEQQSLNDDADSFKWWPVISVGVTYKF
ncbi:hypothetical protein [Hydrogenimonas thermophila]|uniref:Outer membrane protein n=1 Tax=Hydrogenimonas thermophila TaxID=223786 RepID=A0A1I5NZU4_9BACT|nr:hypothetical protein [Hydrogenimonas thermophila]SFP27302.1 hypothetical protein SAMN05216234_1131 [Hydrogenimonas thermophila]